MGLLKKAASGVLAIFPCSRITHTLRASKWLRPCWTAFLNRPAAFDGVTSSWANLHVNIFIIQHSLDGFRMKVSRTMEGQIPGFFPNLDDF
jgi:hypothetical protein